VSGRDQAADGAIRELIEACREGRGGALLLVGPQSVRTVEAEASRSHVSVVRAAARAGDREFGLVRRLIEPLVAGRHGDDPIFAGVGGYAWERVDRAADETGHEDHESLVYGLAWLLRLLSQEADPRILLAEGPEAADAGSLRVLQVLSRQARSHGPAIVTVSKEAGHADVPGLEGFESPDEAVLSSAPPSGSLDLPRLREQLDRTVDPDLRAEMLFRLVGGLIEVGQAGSAADLAEGEIERCLRAGREPNVRVLVAAARASRLLLGRRERAVELTDRIAAIPAADGGPGRDFLGEIALEMVNTVETGRDRVVAAGLAALDDGDLPDSSFSEGLGWFFGCYALHLAERNRDALAVLDRAVVAACHRQSLPEYVRAVALRSGPLFHLGYMREAAVDCELALAAGIGELELWLPAVRSTLIQVRTYMGDLDGARRIADGHVQVGEETAPSMLFRFGRSCLRRFEGDPEQALVDLREAGSLMVVGRGDNPAQMPWRAVSAVVLMSRDRAGDRGKAVTLAEEEYGLAERFGSPGPIGTARWALASCENDGPAKLEMLRDAVDSHRRGERMAERLEVEIALGAELSANGFDRDARELLRGTLHLAYTAGADLLAERARSVLVAAGGKPRREAASGPAALTPSERRVVDLAAEGLSNRQIAEVSFLTVKTIEWHLTRAYGKLGISDRSELAEVLDGAARGFRDPDGRDPFLLGPTV